MASLGHGFSQTQVDTVQTLSEITVSATRLPSDFLSSTRSVVVVEIDSVISRPAISIAEQLNQIPGIFNLNALNFAQDLRISLRGFGSRSAFGVRGLKILVDGVPISTPDGQSQFDHIDPGAVGRIQVINGSSSSLYGNAAGGMIAIENQPVYDGGVLQVMGGSYGLLRSMLKYGSVWAENSLEGRISTLNYSGFRAHSRTANYQAELRYAREITSGQVRAMFNYTNSPSAQDPGGVNLMDVTNDRRAARDRNVAFDTGEELSQFIASVTVEKKSKSNIDFTGSAFLTSRNFSNRLPFENGGQVDLNRVFFGSTVKASQDYGETSWAVGLDLESQHDHRQRYANNMGSRGGLSLDQDEIFSNIGLFSAAAFTVSAPLVLDVGFRLDRIHIEAQDQFRDNGDQSGQRSYWHGSPSLGLNYKWSTSQAIYANYAHSFESPTLSALSANPAGSGGFNEDLEPVLANQFELGLKGANPRGTYQIALFHIDLKNDLLPFELSEFPGRTFFRNTAASRRSGIEIGLNYRSGTYLDFQMSYSWSRFTFGEGDADLEGNRTPAVPEHNAFTNLNFHFGNGTTIAVDARYQGLLYADDENSVEVDPILLLGVRARQKIKLGALSLSIYGGVQNLTDTRYFDNIRINAFGGRFYESGPGINGYLGVQFFF